MIRFLVLWANIKLARFGKIVKQGAAIPKKTVVPLTGLEPAHP